MTSAEFTNPFKPGAGHMPPYLAGRDEEKEEFHKLLQQKTILKNMILTGLRGTGKTVLLDTFKPTAIQEGWLWVGANLSESASVSETSMVKRLLADLSTVTSGISIGRQETPGFSQNDVASEITLNYETLSDFFEKIPGLISDKLKATLEFVWKHINKTNTKGIIFAYDEAQNMSDHPEKEQYPLSMLLDVFQSIQKKDIPFMLAFVGLPKLLSKLVEIRTYSERMFKTIYLFKLSDLESKDAIVKPIEDISCPVKFNEKSITIIIKESGGYPYFIQFICREVYDIFLQKVARGEENPSVPIAEIITKLDTDFFAGRWTKTTDRERELLTTIAKLPNSDEEFTVAEIAKKTQSLLLKPISASQISQMLSVLIEKGLIYKNRYGKYSFAVPLLGEYILRREVKLS
ncbi:MAG: ATP-binding protein [Candidatus Nealsonbacteria bacterium]